MNKETFIKLLNNWYEETGYSPEDCHVSHGGSMLMMDLRKETEDIDLTVSKEIWEDLIDKGFKVVTLPATEKYPEVNIISVTDVIDVHLINGDYSNHLLFDRNVYYRDIETTLHDKLQLNRSKDAVDIQTLLKLLNK